MSINRLTPKQEAFAREYVRCGIGADAYAIAYNCPEKTKRTTLYREGSRLLSKPQIYARVKALWEEGTDVTLGELVAGYRQSKEIALEDRNPAAVTGATTGLARVKGFLKDDPAKAGDIHIHFDDLLRGVL